MGTSTSLTLQKPTSWAFAGGKGFPNKNRLAAVSLRFGRFSRPRLDAPAITSATGPQML
jgi:hypothetical protein